MANIYLTEQGSTLRKTGDRLIVQKDDEVLLDVQCSKINAVLIFGNVQFTGPKYNEDLISILRDALAVVVPTEWYDNSPLVILQAFSLGKPVIASNIDGIPEIVQDGEEGLLFQPGNVDELVERMKVLESNEELRLRLGRGARSKAAALLTAEKRFQGLLAVIEYAQKNTIHT